MKSIELNQMKEIEIHLRFPDDGYAVKIMASGTASDGTNQLNVPIETQRLDPIADTETSTVWEAINARDWNTVIKTAVKSVYQRGINVDPS